MATVSSAETLSSASSSSPPPSSASSSNIPKLMNVQCRSKRSIHYKKPNFSAEFVKQFGNAAMLDEDESDDEEFVPSSDDDELEIDEGDDDDDNDGGDGGGSISRSNSGIEDESTCRNRSTRDSGSDNDDDKSENGEAMKKATKEIKPRAKSEDNGKVVIKKKVNKPKAKEETKTAPKTQQRRKRRKKINRQMKAKNDDSDMDTRKILGSFKNAKIAIGKTAGRKRQMMNGSIGGGNHKNNTSLGGENKSTTSHSNHHYHNNNNNNTTITNNSNSGPYVKLIKQKLKIDEASGKKSIAVDYDLFVVKSANEREQNDNNEANAIDSTLSKSYKLLVPKEKPAGPVLDQSTIPLCAMCANQSNFLPGIGELFGPYRISADYENDLFNETIEVEQGELKKDEKNFLEIWLHEGCAVWSPQVYSKNNRIYGIANAIKNSLEMKCSCCKKNGASLACRHTTCKRAYHFPCALKNECTFNESTFTVLCKQHSTHLEA